ncbi:four-helix bundle copper-binding protein [Halorarum halophilum]|uniref:four-helix bundle copper-binding protein n=1 Tax=Halorarum halophilum TaxID=2743090 RepID=UPI0037434E87
MHKFESDDEADGGEGMAKCLRLCRIVADLTTLHARFMARNSGYGAELAEACAGAFEEYAEECDCHDAEHCQVCADILRDCAESYRNMMSA